MARRLIITAGWFAAAILAVLVGLVAVSVIGDGLTSPATRVISGEEAARQLAEEPAPPAPLPSGLSAAPSPITTRHFTTRGGSVVATCDTGGAVIVSMAPAQGWSVHDRDTGPQDAAEGEFRDSGDGKNRVEVEVRCDGPVPVLTARDDR